MKRFDYRHSDKPLQENDAKLTEFTLGKLSSSQPPHTILFVEHIVILESYDVWFQREADLYAPIKGAIPMRCIRATTDEDSKVCSMQCPYVDVGLQGNGLCMILTCCEKPRLIVSNSHNDERRRTALVNDGVRRIEVPNTNEEDETA
jgi:hypothetical protein